MKKLVVCKATMRRLFLLLSFIVISANSVKAQTVLSAQEFNTKLNATTKAILLDVRTKEEFIEGHIKGALNIDVYDDEFRNNLKSLDRSKPVFVYCRSGKRSSLASKILKEEGFKVIYDLKGGILAWIDEKLLTSK